MGHRDSRLDGILDALDTRWPQVSYRVMAFPEGQRHIRLKHPDGGRALLFVDEEQWICVHEGPSDAASQSILGRVGEPPDDIVSRLRFFTPESSGPGWRRVLLAISLGLICGVGTAVVVASVVVLLVRGYRYTDGADVYRWIIGGLAVAAGAAVGGVVTRVVWARGRR